MPQLYITASAGFSAALLQPTPGSPSHPGLRHPLAVHCKPLGSHPSAWVLSVVHPSPVKLLLYNCECSLHLLRLTCASPLTTSISPHSDPTKLLPRKAFPTPFVLRYNSHAYTHPFKVYNKVVFNMFPRLCHHHHDLIPEHLHHLKKRP